MPHRSPLQSGIGSGHGLVHVTLGAHSLRHNLKVADRPKMGGGIRGKIQGLSRESALRLKEKVFSLVFPEKSSWFLTLTYPVEKTSDPDRARRDIDVFGKRFSRRWSGGGFIWRIEPHKDGRPHFHLLVWGVEVPKAEMICWVSRNWFEIVGSGLEKHFRAGTNVSKIESHRGVAHYVGKYLSKAGLGFSGRQWGVIGLEPAQIMRFRVQPRLFYDRLFEWGLSKDRLWEVCEFTRIFQRGAFSEWIKFLIHNDETIMGVVNGTLCSS